MLSKSAPVIYIEVLYLYSKAVTHIQPDSQNPIIAPDWKQILPSWKKYIIAIIYLLVLDISVTNK
jgi:hypothetical protein